MLATIHDPAASPAVGAGFAAERLCLCRLILTQLLFCCCILLLERDQAGTAPAQRGEGVAGRRTWRLSGLGMPTARTFALRAGKSAWE